MIGKPLIVFSGKLSKKHKSDAGWDIHADADFVIPQDNSEAITTNLKVGVPKGNVGLVKPRSGLSFNHNIETGAGVIDEGYRGEVVVHLYNHGFEPFRVKKGDRIAQLLILPVDTRQYIAMEEVDDTDRGEDGFGKSGSGEEIE